MIAKTAKKWLISHAVNWGYVASSTKMKSPPVRAVMLYRMTVTFVTSLASRSYRYRAA